MWINRILWAIYLALLGVLLPHTAWAFQQFEPEGMEIVGWVAAFTFEAAIAAFTWKLKQRIERTPRYTAGKVWLRKAAYRSLNAYGIALFAALWLSSAANWSHAVEFGGTFKVFAKYSIPPGVFSVAFGAILPLISLLFAWVLAEAKENEVEANPEFEKAKETIKELRKQLREAEDARTLAEERFGAIGDLAARLFATEKRQRILAARERWPELPAGTIALITESSPSYVSEVLSEDQS